MIETLTAAWDWLERHPVLRAELVALATGLLFRTRTQAQWEWLKQHKTRLAALVQLYRAVTVDVPKFRQWLPVLLTGELPRVSTPPAPLRMPRDPSLFPEARPLDLSTGRDALRPPALPEDKLTPPHITPSETPTSKRRDRE